MVVVRGWLRHGGEHARGEAVDESGKTPAATAHRNNYEKSTDTVGKVGTRYRYFGHFNTYRTSLIRYSRVSYPRYPRIPRYFRISIPTVPAISGIFESHTYDTHAYPGILGFRYLSYRQNQVFSKAIPTIPTHTPVFLDFDTYRTGKIRYFQGIIPTIPRYFWISIPTVPARSGISRYNTYDTHAYPGMAYPGKYRG